MFDMPQTANPYILKTIEWLRKGGEDADREFNMDYIYYNEGEWCRSACCICGYMAFIMYEDGVIKLSPQEVHSSLLMEEASNFIGDKIGLTNAQAQEAFLHYPKEITVTPDMAADMLQHYVEAGEIDWSVVYD